MKLHRMLLMVCLLTYTFSLFGLPNPPDRPRIWVYSDYATSTDPDDQVVMSVLLLWANEFRIEGIVPGAHKKNLANNGYNLFNQQHMPGYENDYPNLSACYSNYPSPSQLKSRLHKCSTSDGKGYRSINNINDYPSVKKLIEAARKGSASDPLYVLLWGPQGDAATAVDWLIRNEPATLNKMVFIAHASLPSASKYNCNQDATACSKLKNWAKQGKIKFVECGDSGQMGIHKHQDGRKLANWIQKEKGSIGEWMKAKWSGGYPDWSDGASFVCLMPQFGVDFSSLASNSNNNTNYLTKIYKNKRSKMYDLIEERATKAKNGGCNVVKYTISASAGNNGNITPNGDIKVNKGDNKTFTITPNAGYDIKDVLVNGSSIGTKASYTFTGVTKDQSISATFKVSTVKTYTISATAGANGSITPSGDVVVNQGANQTFSIKAASGYKINNVKVDNTSVGAKSSYTFTNVSANHSIVASFAKVTGNVTKTVNLTPIHDAYIQSGTGKNVNVIRLEPKKRVGYMMFDLSAIDGTISSVKLKLKCATDPGSGNVKINLGKTNNWTEKNLSNKNKPAAGVQLGVLNKTYKVGTTYTWNLNAASVKAGGKVSMVITQTTGKDVAFGSKENAKNKPVLEVTYTTGGGTADCAGVVGGSAYIDDCGDCVGGTTGKEPCVIGAKDCAGIVGGTAYIDDCGDCVGGTTGLEPCVIPPKDCAGVPGGTAYIDDCGDCVGGTTGKEPCVIGNCTDVTLNATTDFPNINVNGFVPAYVDNKRKALAVNAKQYKGKYAAAIATFGGETSTYDITITSLLELDGECTYKLKVAGKLVGSYTNIPTKTDYTPYTHTFEGVSVDNGDKIQVEFNSATNKTVPEGNGWAYARGRWTKIEFVCVDGGGSDCSTNTDPVVSLSAPVSVQEGFPIQLVADVNDNNMGKVEFYKGNKLVGTATSVPYKVTVTAGVPGIETFKAKAIDKCNAEDVSATVDVTVEKGGGQNCDTYTEIGGLVVMEAENTKSALGKWQKKSSVSGYSGSGHIEFTGNAPKGGSANSPLNYKFTINQAGDYKLLFRAHKRLAGAESDHCNDAYVKVTGDYEGVSYPTSTLTKNTKFFGGGANGWAWAQKLEDHNHKKVHPVYRFKAGKTYTLTVSGRSQRFNIDRIIFYKTSVGLAAAQAANKETKNCKKSQFEVVQPTNNFEVYPNPASHTINLDVNSTTNVNIYNMQGKLVYSEVLNSLTTISSTELGGTGLYFIKANDKSYKLIVE